MGVLWVRWMEVLVLRQTEVLWVKIVGGYGLRLIEVMVSDRKGFCG